MGGFFAPDPPSTPAPTVVAAAPAAAVDAGEERRAAISRNRRGLAGTIATSETGLLQDVPARTGKTLLGE